MTHVHHLQIGNGANQVWNSPESDAPLALALSTWQPRGPSLRVDLEMLKIDAFFFLSVEIDNFQPDYREKWQQKTAQIWQKEEEEEPGILLIVDVDDDDCPFCSMEKPFSRPPPPPPCGKRISAQITPCTNNGGIFPPVLAVPRSSQVNGIMTAEYWWESTTSTGVPPRVHWGGKSGPGKSWLFSNAEERKGVSSDFADENHVALFPSVADC